MIENSNPLIETVFNILFGFIVFKILIYLCLICVKRNRTNKLLATFWILMLIGFVLQAIYQTGDLTVALTFSVCMLPSMLFAHLGFEAINRKFPWEIYLISFTLILPLSILFSKLGFGFTFVAMPIALVNAAPFFHLFLNIHFIDRKHTTGIQKILGSIALLMVIQCINFPLFRMDPKVQLWGLPLAFALLDLMSILLPMIALEAAELSESKRLQMLVNEKTMNLDKAFQTNQNLFKVLIHDIGSPLMVLRFYVGRITKDEPTEISFIDKIKNSLSTIDHILKRIKELHLLNSFNKTDLHPVEVDECFRELGFIFSSQLKKKNITLKLNNELQPGTKVLAVSTGLTHGVLGNLLSNAIKYSDPGSVIEINAREVAPSIHFQINDSGPGIPKEIVKSVLEKNILSNLGGTLGERGTGVGLSIVKSMVDSFGGKMEFESNFINEGQENIGTVAKITISKA
jgi:signal transduction histidine kinase